MVESSEGSGEGSGDERSGVWREMRMVEIG